eukprot:gb/GECG01009503.1/.p1 GENE.gb/GECG01009503.1/~~gb/GECG01009503.1/.p1  ORF type:complete len:173 (+),score=18.99 gb/GECG01009503.1/:1-519(+)
MSSSSSSLKKVAPATERNKEPLLKVLREILPVDKKLRFLEVCSGYGQHAAYFASEQRNWTIQTSEYEVSKFESIKAYASEHSNVLDPINLDLRSGSSNSSWGYDASSFDVVFCANLTHIAPWEATTGLIQGSSRVLANKGWLFIYGMFFVGRFSLFMDPQPLHLFRSVQEEW